MTFTVGSFWLRRGRGGEEGVALCGRSGDVVDGELCVGW